MDRRAFMMNFNAAADRAVEFARLFVIQRLPDDVAFRLYPNQSYDGNPLVGDEQLFPQDSLNDEKHLGPMTFQEVVDFLWRDGKVPEWIDVSIEGVTETQSIVGLTCCGRFTAEVKRLYYNQEGGIPPFSVKGPALPPGWQGLEKSPKFDLYWFENQHRAPEADPG